MDKKKRLAYAKSVDSEKKTITAYVSTYEWDRTDEKFAPGAWDLANYKNNPVVLWGHDGSQPPIGRTLDIREDEKGLLAVSEFDTESQRGAEVFGLFERGFLHAFSVGFQPKAYQMEQIEGKNTKGLVWTDAELLEFSAVSIPANPGAVIGRELAEMAMKCLGENVVTKGMDDTFIINAPELVKAEEPPIEKLGSSLEQIINLARIVKGQPLDESKRALIGTATSVLTEIVAEKEEITPEQMKQLLDVTANLAELAGQIHPAHEKRLDRMLSEIKKAVGK